MVRFFLGASALLWLPYGIYCFADPGSLTGAAGVTTLSPTGTIELRAMYGGLQIAIGLLAGAALLQSSLVRPALVTIAFLCAGLFAARLLAALLAPEFSSYTMMGLGFESVSFALASWLLARGSEPLPARETAGAS